MLFDVYAFKVFNLIYCFLSRRGSGFSRRERIPPSFPDEGPRRGRYPYGDGRPEYSMKRQRPRRDSEGIFSILDLGKNFFFIGLLCCKTLIMFKVQ